MALEIRGLPLGTFLPSSGFRTRQQASGGPQMAGRFSFYENRRLCCVLNQCPHRKGRLREGPDTNTVPRRQSSTGVMWVINRLCAALHRIPSLYAPVSEGIPCCRNPLRRRSHPAVVAKRAAKSRSLPQSMQAVRSHHGLQKEK